MKKIIISERKTDEINCIQTFGDGSTGIVKGKNGELAIYDKTNNIFITPFVKGSYRYDSNVVFIIDEDNNLYIYNYIKKRIIAYKVKNKYYDIYGIIACFNKETNQYYLISTQEDIFKTFNNIEIKENDYETLFFVVTDKKGKGIYQPTKNGLKCLCATGTVKEIEKDEYYFSTYYIVTTKKNKKCFIYRKYKSQYFDNIKNTNDYLICQKGNTSYIYEGERIRYKIESEDSINNGCTEFIIKRNGKYGIIRCKDNYFQYREEELVPCIYDKISFENFDDCSKNVYYLHKDGKIGLYSKIIKNGNNTIDPEYESIEHIFGNVFLFTETSGKKKLIDIHNIKTLDEGFDSIIPSQDESNYPIIYTKAGKYGYISPLYNKPKKVIDNLDNIRFIKEENGYKYYELQKGKNNGLIMDDEILVPIKEGQRLEFFPGSNIFVIYDEKSTHICTYNYIEEKKYEELYTIPKKCKVEYLGKNDYNKDLFEIDGISYIYEYPNFKENMKYYALYEFENGSVYSVTDSGKVHNDFVNMIESTPEIEIEKTLIKMRNK